MVLIPRTSPRHSFGARPQEVARLRSETPGPGHYGALCSPASRCFSRSGGTGFGTAARGDREQRPCPGPGHYAAKALAPGPKYSCSPRRPAEGGSPVIASPWAAAPGPGAYSSSHVEFEGPKYSFAGRRGEEQAVHPGPGHYSDPSYATARRRTKSGFSFGNSTREPGSARRMPGPGHYSIASTVGSAAQYSMPARPAIRAPDPHSSPGPGQHNLKPEFGE
mmetsp:Transcript_41690/g.116158  ORF Transcript_41690/g.116158 Transcript_41690/m.116158 type:complete len:221 (-) Transcript_41690:120-782(-)